MRSCVLPLVLAAALFLSTEAFGGVPQMINYQGKLTTPEGALIDTTVTMTFAIYPVSAEGTPLWDETHDSVVVEKGVFSILLGSIDPVPNQVFEEKERYLGIKVGNNPEMMPRKKIASVGYAYNSDMLDGKNAGNEAGNIPVSDGNLNVNLNADYLDGLDSQTILSPVKRVILDTMFLAPPYSPRTKEFSPPIDPTKSVVLLGHQYDTCRLFVWELTSSSITIHIHCPILDRGGYIDYQIIEYR